MPWGLWLDKSKKKGVEEGKRPKRPLEVWGEKKKSARPKWRGKTPVSGGPKRWRKTKKGSRHVTGAWSG